MNLKAILLINITLALVACESVSPEPAWNNPLDPQANIPSSEAMSSMEQPSSSSVQPSSSVEQASSSSVELSSSSATRNIPYGNLWDYGRPINVLPDGYEIAGHQAMGRFFTLSDSNEIDLGNSQVWPSPSANLQHTTWAALCDGPICMTGSLGDAMEYPYFQLSYKLFATPVNFASQSTETLCVAYEASIIFRLNLRASPTVTDNAGFNAYGIDLESTASCSVIEKRIDQFRQEPDWGTALSLGDYLTEIEGLDFIDRNHVRKGEPHTLKIYSLGLGVGSCLCP